VQAKNAPTPVNDQSRLRAGTRAREVFLSFSVTSYNVLATAYIHRARYSRTPTIILDRTWRVPALVQHISRLETDIICLQEVETETLAPLRVRLGGLGYGVQFGRKGGGKPDGCATFYRQNRFEFMDVRLLAYDDAGGDVRDSGHVALVMVLKDGDRSLGVINTHLTWDPPATPPERRRGRRQMFELLERYRNMAAAAPGWIIAGDLNVTPDSDLIAILETAGFQFAHRPVAGIRTCNVNGEAKMIDYLFYSSSLRAEPQPVTPIEDRTVLPSAEEPSDHVAIRSSFSWRD
jgi:mRNA deadenylase 3'-5' endonuclease subunit Ccr4